MVSEPPAAGMPKSMPEPDSETNCGLFTAESVRVSVPERVPEEVGVNVTWIVQVPLFAAIETQLLVCAKSPVAWIPVTVRGPLPELVTVMVWALPVVPTVSAVKVRVEALSCAAPARPVPLKLTACGLPCALSLIVRVPV